MTSHSTTSMKVMELRKTNKRKTYRYYPRRYPLLSFSTFHARRPLLLDYLKMKRTGIRHYNIDIILGMFYLSDPAGRIRSKASMEETGKRFKIKIHYAHKLKHQRFLILDVKGKNKTPGNISGRLRIILHYLNSTYIITTYITITYKTNDGKRLEK